jgi:hypothetical protein
VGFASARRSSELAAIKVKHLEPGERGIRLTLPVSKGERGGLTTGMDRGVHPIRLKQLGQHKSYAVLCEYLELGDPSTGTR